MAKRMKHVVLNVARCCIAMLLAFGKYVCVRRLKRVWPGLNIACVLSSPRTQGGPTKYFFRHWLFSKQGSQLELGATKTKHNKHVQHKKCTKLCLKGTQQERKRPQVGLRQLSKVEILVTFVQPAENKLITNINKTIGKANYSYTETRSRT